MSESVQIDDLGDLDGPDLRAVLDQLSESQVLDALIGISPAFRKQLLGKLPAASAGRLEARINTHGPVAIEAVHAAQRAVVEALCRLSRGGQVAFDVPEDMVA